MIAPPDHQLLSLAISKLISQQKVAAELLPEETIIARKPGSGTWILLERFITHFTSEEVFTKKKCHQVKR